MVKTIKKYSGQLVLPNLKLKNTLYEVLYLLPISEARLESSNGLGKVINVLCTHPLETKKNKILLKQILQKWLRNTFNNKVDYRNLAQYDYNRRNIIANRKKNLEKNTFNPKLSAKERLKS